MDNLRTVKSDDLRSFVKTVLDSHATGYDVCFTLYSFYFDFYFLSDCDDNSQPHERIQSALDELYRRGIIAEKPSQKFKDCMSSKKHVTFILSTLSNKL